LSPVIAGIKGNITSEEFIKREYVKLLWVPCTASPTIDSPEVELGVTFSVIVKSWVVPLPVTWILYVA
jgi:hypothetical protein